MTIYTHFMTMATEQSITDSSAIVDHLKGKLEPLAGAIKECGAKLILHYQENGPCQLVVHGPQGLQQEIRALVGSAEMWI